MVLSKTDITNALKYDTFTCLMQIIFLSVFRVRTCVCVCVFDASVIKYSISIFMMVIIILFYCAHVAVLCT